jgi:hypothetical protein
MNAVMDLQRNQGHKVIFVSDAKPTQTINADQIIYANDVSGYVPNMRKGHVWIQVEDQLIHDMDGLYNQHKLTPDLVIAHDLHSYYAAQSNYVDGIFVQHETDILTPNSRYSYLDDDYINLQKLVVKNTDWRIGMTVESDNIKPKRPVYTPFPFDVVPDPNNKRTRDLLYIGDSSERKGAKEFMKMAKALKIKPTVITHDPDAKVFKGADIFSFSLDQRDEMYKLMSECRVAYIPSKNECPGLAILECLQFMPVVVNLEYAWTKYLIDVKVVRSAKEDREFAINHFLESRGNEQREALDLWAKNSKQFWRNLSA